MRSLHLGQQRQDVLGIGHKGGVAQIAGDGLVALAVERGLDQVLDVRDARDVVGVLVIDGDAAEAGLAHGGQHVGDRLVVLAHGGVHARHHDLASHGVAQVEDLVDHALFLVEQVVLLRDHVLDLFLRDVLAVVGALDAQDAGQAIGASAGQPHERTGDLLEHGKRAHDLLGHTLGIGQADALGDELADHDGYEGPELSLIAKNKERFAEIGVTIIGSSYDLCEMALDKMQMFTWLKEHGYNCAKSYVDKEAFYKDLDAGEISFPVFVKPVRGSASIAINKVKDKETMDLLWAHDDNLMIQEFLNGQEIGGDCYIDMISSELVSVFTKKKILMRAGETDKAVSFKDEKLFALIEKFVKECGWSGQIDIDIFDIDGEYYISEVNPRFGGGYPHAYECGCNHMKLIKNNLIGVANEKNIGAYEEGIYMMKYNEVMIRRKES